MSWSAMRFAWRFRVAMNKKKLHALHASSLRVEACFVQCLMFLVGSKREEGSMKVRMITGRIQCANKKWNNNSMSCFGQIRTVL